MDDPDLQAMSLNQMVIRSCDALREREIELTIPSPWKDRPPLLLGPQGNPETTILLKRVSNCV
jgi:hypothetical protein